VYLTQDLTNMYFIFLNGYNGQCIYVFIYSEYVFIGFSIFLIIFHSHCITNALSKYYHIIINKRQCMYTINKITFLVIVSGTRFLLNVVEFNLVPTLVWQTSTKFVLLLFIKRNMLHTLSTILQ